MCQNPERNLHQKILIRFGLMGLILLCMEIVSPVRPALAHKVTIFAWVEGDTVHSRSKFSGGKCVKHGTVAVYDREENLLLQGETDENGGFSFKIPGKTELKVVLKASMGHSAEWTIPAEEIQGVGEAPVGTRHEAPPEAEARDQQTPDEARGGTEAPLAVTGGLSREAVQKIVDDSLDRKLAPLVGMLADSLDRGPKMSDVIGGIGYIFGLVGVALYFLNRRENK